MAFISIFENVSISTSTLLHIFESHMIFSRWVCEEYKSYLFAKDLEELRTVTALTLKHGIYRKTANKSNTRDNIRVTVHFDQPVGLTADGLFCHLLVVLISSDDLTVKTVLPTPCCSCKCPFKHGYILPKSPCYSSPMNVSTHKAKYISSTGKNTGKQDHH